MAKLTGGVAVIRVGAATETELKERKLRIEDALNTTKAGVESINCRARSVSLFQGLRMVDVVSWCLESLN